jgi:hypothetical protein
VNIDRLVIDGTLDEIFAQRKQLLTPCEPLWFPNSESHFSSEMLSPPELPVTKYKLIYFRACKKILLQASFSSNYSLKNI